MDKTYSQYTRNNQLLFVKRNFQNDVLLKDLIRQHISEQRKNIATAYSAGKCFGQYGNMTVVDSVKEDRE